MLSRETYDIRYSSYSSELENSSRITDHLFQDNEHPWHASEDFAKYFNQPYPAMKQRLQEAYAIAVKRMDFTSDSAAISISGTKDFKKVINHPEGYDKNGRHYHWTKDVVLKVCATLGVSPNYVRGYQDSGILARRMEGTLDCASANEIAALYDELIEENRCTVTSVVIALLQSQRARKRIGEATLDADKALDDLYSHATFPRDEEGEGLTDEEIKAFDEQYQTYKAKFRSAKTRFRDALWFGGVSD